MDDSDVKEEEKRIKEGTYPPDTAVVIEDLMKVFKSNIFSKSFTAVKGLSFTMQNNQLFCLLGPNGAGMLEERGKRGEREDGRRKGLSNNIT